MSKDSTIENLYRKIKILKRITKLEERIDRYERNIELEEPSWNNPFAYSEETRDEYAHWNHIHVRRVKANKEKLPRLRKKLRILEMKLNDMDN
jgi:hypothetical protein